MLNLRDSLLLQMCLLKLKAWNIKSLQIKLAPASHKFPMLHVIEIFTGSCAVAWLLVPTTRWNLHSAILSERHSPRNSFMSITKAQCKTKNRCGFHPFVILETRVSYTLRTLRTETIIHVLSQHCYIICSHCWCEINMFPWSGIISSNDQCCCGHE